MAGFNLGNALAGAGSAVADVAGDYAKAAIARNTRLDILKVEEQIQRDRDARLHDYSVVMKTEVEPRGKLAEQGLLAPGKAREADEAAEREIRTAKGKPRTLAPGSSEVVDGKVTLTAPIEKPQELLDYYTANANRLNAEADAIRAGEKYRERPGRAERPILPKIKVETKDGEPYSVDEHSGAVGRIVPGTPEVKGEKNLIFADKPGRAATPARMEWTLNGQVLPGGLGDIYPDLRARGVGAPSGSPQPGGGGPTPDVAPVPGARKAADGKWYRPREGGGYERVDVVADAAAREPAPARRADAPTAPSRGILSAPIEGVNTPRQSTMPALTPTKSQAIERALQTPNLSTAQKAQLSRQLQDALREEGVFQ